MSIRSVHFAVIVFFVRPRNISQLKLCQLPTMQYKNSLDNFPIMACDAKQNLTKFGTFYRAATAAKDAKDWSLASFGSHLNPISTRRGRLCPPYTGVLSWLKFAVAALFYIPY